MDDLKNNSLAVVGYALLALVISGFLLLLVFLAMHWTPASGRSGNIALPAGSFKAVIGSATVNSGQLSVTGFEGDTGQEQAVITAMQPFDASDYPFVSVGFGAITQGVQAYLFWKPANVDGFYNMPLPLESGYNRVLDMRHYPDWKGRMSEIGVAFAAGSPSAMVIFNGISLEQDGFSAALRSLFTQWTLFRGFDQVSINRLPAAYPADALSPVPVMATWAGCALVTVAIISLLGKGIPHATYPAVVLVVWVLLDLLWQRQISTQLDLERSQYQGKSMAQRHARDADGPLYQYAMQLKAESLPVAPVRLFILHNSYDHNYQRLKMQYYLLPHNIYNFGLFPPPGSVRAGDYVLVLGSIPGLEYDQAAATIKWEGGGKLSVSMEHNHALGRLFRVTSGSAPPPVAATRDAG